MEFLFSHAFLTEVIKVSTTSSVLQMSTGESRNQMQGTIDPGDTAWMISASCLVLFMTIPGLAVYYAGMVQSKNVLAVVMQTFTITCVITFLWLAFGYSLAFTPTGYQYLSNDSSNISSEPILA